MTTTKPKSRFHGTNPFTGKPVDERKHKPIDPASLVIDDVPIGKRSVQVNPLDEIFDKVKPGQRVSCNPGDEQRIKGAMERWLKRIGAHDQYRLVTKRLCEDGRGGVWLKKK